MIFDWLLVKAESSGSDQYCTTSSSESLSELFLSSLAAFWELIFAVTLVTLREFRRSCEAKAAKSLTDERLEAI